MFKVLGGNWDPTDKISVQCLLRVLKLNAKGHPLLFWSKHGSYNNYICMDFIAKEVPAQCIIRLAMSHEVARGEVSIYMREKY